MNLKGSLICLVSVFISSCAQILLKKSAQKKYDSLIREYFNWHVIVGYTLFFASTLITIYAFSKINLSLGIALESMGYVFIAALSRIFLHEKSNIRQLTGYGLIILGVIIFSIF